MLDANEAEELQKARSAFNVLGRKLQMKVLERRLEFLSFANLKKINEVGCQQESVGWYVNAQTFGARQTGQSLVNKLSNRLEVIVWKLVACRTDHATILQFFSALERPEIEEGLAGRCFQIAALHYNEETADDRIIYGQRPELCK